MLGFRTALKDQIAQGGDPASWYEISDLLENFVSVFENTIVTHLKGVTQSAEQASAILFCTVLVSRRGGIEPHFRRMIEIFPGNSFGVKMINWTVGSLMADIPEVQMIWTAAFRRQIGYTVDMLLRELGLANVPLTPDEVLLWINTKGGMGQLEKEFRRLRDAEKKAGKIGQERDKEARRTARARRAGFDTVEESEAAAFRDRLGSYKAELVERGTHTTGIFPPDRLFISGPGGLYQLSEADELALLRCGIGGE
jgi:hypothetical protein